MEIPVQKRSLMRALSKWTLRIILGAAVLAWVAAGLSVFSGVAGKLSSRFLISGYVRSHPIRKLQIGAGGNSLPGWLNTDIEPLSGQAYLDASKTFPLPDRSFKYIFSEHVIEHLTREDGVGMLRECYRVLGPGGKIRIATPNLLKFVQLFQTGRTDDMRRWMDRKLKWHGWPSTASPECIILNFQLTDFGHKFVYDPTTLRESLTAAGFQEIAEFEPGESDDPGLRDLEARHRASIRDINDYETMVFQAVRSH